MMATSDYTQPELSDQEILQALYRKGRQLLSDIKRMNNALSKIKAGIAAFGGDEAELSKEPFDTKKQMKLIADENVTLHFSMLQPSSWKEKVRSALTEHPNSRPVALTDILFKNETKLDRTQVSKRVINGLDFLDKAGELGYRIINGKKHYYLKSKTP